MFHGLPIVKDRGTRSVLYVDILHSSPTDERQRQSQCSIMLAFCTVHQWRRDRDTVFCTLSYFTGPVQFTSDRDRDTHSAPNCWHGFQFTCGEETETLTAFYFHIFNSFQWWVDKDALNVLYADIFHRSPAVHQRQTDKDNYSNPHVDIPHVSCN